MEEKKKKLVFWEIFCVVAWLLTDGFWLYGWVIPTYAASAFMILACIKIFTHMEWKPAAYRMALADTLWVGMTIFWASEEFSGVLFFGTAAKVFFWGSLTFFALAFLASDYKKDFTDLVMRRLRFLIPRP